MDELNMKPAAPAPMKPELPPHHVSGSMKVLMLILALVVIAALGYLVWFQNSMPTGEEDNSVNPVKTTNGSTTTVGSGTTGSTSTASWKTYTSAQYGLSFKYPDTWTLTSAGTGQSVVAYLTSPETKAAHSGTTALLTSAYDVTINYYASVADETENRANNLGATTLTELFSKNTMLTKIGNVTVGNVTGTDAISAGQSSYYTIFTEKNGHLFRIFFDNTMKKADLTSTLKTLLTTFVFN